MAYKNIYFLFLLIVISMGLHAADSLPVAPFGFLHISPHAGIKVISSEVDINGKMVTDSVLVRNMENKKINYNFFYPLPVFNWEGLSNDYFDKDFPELFIESKNNKIKPKVITESYVGRENVSAVMSSHGIDPLMVASPDINKFPYVNDDYIDLEKRGIFRRVEDQYFPGWSLAVTLHWEHEMAGKENYSFNSNYLARPGFSILNIDNDDFDEKLKMYCTNLENVKYLMNKYGIKSKYFFVEEYDIPILANLTYKTSINYTPKRDGSNFIPFAIFQCKENFRVVKYKSLTSFKGINAKLNNIKFMLLSYSVEGGG